jgi:hypothetical protein
MPGNETDTIIFIINNKDKLKLKYLNKINKIQIPHNNKLTEVNLDNIKDFYSHDSHKKADIYINNIGISLKQEGGNFSYNRLQRKNLNTFFSHFFTKDEKDDIIKKIDKKVKQFHKNEITRNFPFTDVMTKKNFFKVIKYLMLKGSPNLGETEFTAEMILVSKKKINKVEDLTIFTFNEFFDKFSNQFSFAIRRHWYGQESNSEHKRAVSILKNKDNEPWCFEDSVGTPNGWRKDVAEKDRKTVYTLSIEHK